MLQSYGCISVVSRCFCVFHITQCVFCLNAFQPLNELTFLPTLLAGLRSKNKEREGKRWKGEPHCEFRCRPILVSKGQVTERQTDGQKQHPIGGITAARFRTRLALQNVTTSFLLRLPQRHHDVTAADNDGKKPFYFRIGI